MFLEVDLWGLSIIIMRNCCNLFEVDVCMYVWGFNVKLLVRSFFFFNNFFY